MTQLEFAKKNKITAPMKLVAKTEAVSIAALMNKIKSGRAVIPFNKIHRPKNPCGIGEGLTTKVNVNLGTSTDRRNFNLELRKLQIALKYKTDTVMDLSVGGNLRKIRQNLIHSCPVPFGTVPIYEAAINSSHGNGNLSRMTADSILKTLREHAQDGVDFFTVHSGINKKVLGLLHKKSRLMDVVSRGGAILVNWMLRNHEENPLFEYFDEVIDIAREFDVTLSLGDGMRPGTVLDATDAVQLGELNVMGELAKRAVKRGAQVIIEGPGHVPISQIKENIDLEKRRCNHAPFYVLGPLVTDIAPGYDHITSAIGGALAATYGADFLCFVTPSEHLRLPDAEDVKEGLIASRIAAHAADLAKGKQSAWDWDREISLARKKRDWQKQIKLSIDPAKAKQYRDSSRPAKKDVCTMCGKYCSIKLAEECLN